MLNQLINLNIFAFLLVFSRIGSAFTLLPGIGSQQITIRARLGFALAVTLLVTPTVMTYIPAEPKEMSALVLLLASEIFIGIFLGVIPRILLSALQTTGTILSMVSSLSNMFIMDPIAEQQSSVMSSFLGMIGITLVFVTNTHHLMLAAVVDSYSLFPPTGGVVVADMTNYLAHSVADSFRIGVQLSAPLIISGLSYYLGLGILGRLMPQLPIFFFGLPVQIGLQVYLISITLSAMLMVFMRFFEDRLLGFAQVQGF